MDELKVRWCVDLEDILQCPVCFERPHRPIYQCRDGHHICSSCRMKLQVCPMCQGAYNGSRCFIAEHLALKLDDIKSSLLLPPVERQIVSNCTQTEEPEIPPEIKLSQPLAPKGKFPCRMGKCKFDDGHCRMLNHLRYCHKDRLCESTSIDGKMYTRQWEMDHLSNIEFDLAFSIPEMGIFFLISSIDSSGNFMGSVQMVHTNNVAKEFNCKLEMSGNNRTCSYEGFSSLLLPPVERQIVSNCTQTEEPEIPPEIKLSQPLAPKGKFPCRMGKCKFDDGHCRMLNHLRYCHKDRLCESTSIDGKMYTRQWEMDHLSNIEFDLAFSIPEMGIFFLISSIDSSGNFMGSVQMVHTNNVAKEFNCKLEMSGNNRTCSYEGFPRSCRTPADVAFNNSLHISSQDMRRMSDKRNKVNCIFTITREEKKNIPVEKNAK